MSEADKHRRAAVEVHDVGDRRAGGVAVVIFSQ